MLIAGIALAAATAAPMPDVVSIFMTLCRPGHRSAADVLAESAVLGWQGSGSDRTLVTKGGTLTLKAFDRENSGERLMSCGIRTTATVPDLVAITQARLGFAPTVPLGTAATWYAIGDDSGWRAAGRIDTAQFLAAKSAGTFYSIVASIDDAGSTIWDLHTTPDPP